MLLSEKRLEKCIRFLGICPVSLARMLYLKKNKYLSSNMLLKRLHFIKLSQQRVARLLSLH